MRAEKQDSMFHCQERGLYPFDSKLCFSPFEQGLSKQGSQAFNMLRLKYVT